MPLERRREALIALLDDEHPAVQKVANHALERLDAHASLDRLLEELKSNDTALQVQAVYGLAKVPTTRALKLLVQLVRHPKRDVAAAAARAILELRDPRLLKPVLDALPELDPVPQATLLEYVGLFRDRRAVPVLLQLLPRLQPEALERAIAALGRIGDPAAEGVLIEWTRHANPRIRAAAALALGNLLVEEPTT